jgi:hypothetical protein
MTIQRTMHPMGARVATRLQAAAYCNISPSTFDLWVRRGLLPRCLPGTRFWDLAAIDRALDKASGLEGEADEQ